MENFRKLGIIEPILRVIQEEKFEKPSEIQEKSIPLVLAGKDVIAGSATGSGKTLAFGSGIIQYCQKGMGIQALILVPTRELAEQVKNSLRTFSRYKQLDIVAIYGGVSINPQMDMLRRTDVVVATPGRLLDHMERRSIELGRIKILVLDEADRMLDMGFIDDVERIIRQCPKEKQVLLFSATIPKDIAQLAHHYMKQPMKVSAIQYVDPKKLIQVYYNVPDNMKFSLLVHLLKNESSGLVMVFCNTQRNTDFVAKNLRHNDIEATPIHGGLSQARRTSTMNQFHSKKAHVLVCTDIAARGLHIEGVSHVYNYDIPKESKQYVHRIGRTARAGKEGKAINILSSRDHDNFSRVLRDNQLNMPRIEIPQMERAVINIEQKHGRFQRGNERGHGGGGYGQRYSRPRHGEHENRDGSGEGSYGDRPKGDGSYRPRHGYGGNRSKPRHYHSR